MLKKKGAGFKPKPKGPMPRRNAPGASQGAESQPSQTPTPAPPPTPADSQPAPSTAPNSQTPQTAQTPVVENSPAASSSQVEPATQPTAVIASEAPIPTPPPTAPIETVTVAAPVIRTENTIQEDTEMGEAGPSEAIAIDKPAVDDTEMDGQTTTAAESVSAAPTTAPVQEPTPITTTETSSETSVEPSQPAAKAPTPIRARLPTARRATPIRPPGAATSSISGPSVTPELTATQATQPDVQGYLASAVPAHVQTIQTATPPEEPTVPEAAMDEPQPSVEGTGGTETDDPSAAPAKAKHAPRKRKTAADTGKASGDAAPAAKRSRKQGAAVSATTQAEGEAEKDGESSQGAPARAKRVRIPIVRDASETQSGEEGEGSDGAIAERHPRRRAPGRQRSVTPEDAEEQQVDMRQVKMGDLVKDLKIGKKFSRHEELLERERRRKLEAKMRATGMDPVNPEDGTEAGSTTGTPAPGGAATSSTVKKPADATPSTSSALVSAAPQFQIMDGQIVVNQATLQFDRHQAAADAAGFMEEEEEDDFTHHTTQNTYRKKIQKPNYWNADDTEQFYDALRMFGTDFETIAKMFPGKNRRHLKLKFNREERANPARINSALIGEKTEIDLDEFKQRAGLELRPTQEIMDEDKARGEAFEEEQKRVEEEAAAEEAKKREALFSKGVKEGEEDIFKKKGRGRKKQIGGGGMFG